MADTVKIFMGKAPSLLWVRPKSGLKTFVNLIISAVTTIGSIWMHLKIYLVMIRWENYGHQKIGAA